MSTNSTASRTFEFLTTDAQGQRTRGRIDAPSDAIAAQMLRQRGLVPLSIKATGTGLRRDITIPGLGGDKRVKLKDLSIFSRQFATLTSSGMTLLRSLSVLEAQTPNPRLRKAVADVQGAVGEGASLSTALARHDRVFPQLMISMVRAGEAGGLLDTALERIATNFEKDAALRAKIKGALTYPVIVMLFSLLMIAAVLIFIVPVFEDMFAKLGGDLPLPTQIVVTLSHNMIWAGPLLVVLMTIGTLVFKQQLRARPGLRLATDRLKLRVPVFGPLFRKIAISRFSRNLGTLLSVGVPVLQALDTVGETTGNAVIANATREVLTSVRDGQPMSTQIAKHEVFPPMVAQMIQVGEESGQISQMLDKIADFYDREVDSTAESLTSALEPVLVVLMGVTVGSMIICLYLPMFTIYEHIQGTQ